MSVNIQEKQKEDNFSITHYVNRVFASHAPKELHDTILTLFTISYDTTRFVHSILYRLLPINPIITHQYEYKIFGATIKKLNLLRTKATYLIFANRGGLLVPGTQAYLALGHLLIKPQARKQDVNFQNTSEKILSDLSNESNQSSQEIHIANLKKHTTQNCAYICRSPHNPDEPLYTPKTIAKFRDSNKLTTSKHVKENILKQLNEIANMTKEERGAYLESLTEAQVITQKYCKKYRFPDILIGQKGIFAKKNIPANTVLGYYGGLYFTDNNDITEYVAKVGASYGNYLFSMPDGKMPRVSGFQYGNDLTLVNASTVYSGTAYQIARQIYFMNNIAAIYAKSLEYPDADHVANPDKYDLVSYITTRDIKAGEQLLTDYGSQYWKKRNPDFSDIDPKDIGREFMKLNRKKYKK